MTNAIQRFPVTKEDAVLTNKLLDGVFLRNQSEVTAAIISKLNRIQSNSDLDLETMKKELLAIRKAVAEQQQNVTDLSTAVELSTDDILENKQSIEDLSENVEKNTSKIVKLDKAISEVSTKLNDFLYGSDTDGIINKWKELEKFLKDQTELDTLAELLDVKADIADVYTKDVIDDKHAELQHNIQQINNGLSNNQKAVELLKTDVIDNKNNIKSNADALEECRDDILKLDQTKADKAKTLAGYGIEDAYTKEDVDKSIDEINSSLDDVDNTFGEINVALDKVNQSIEDIGELIDSILSSSPSWDNILDKPEFSDVAFSGDYSDIINTPGLVDFVGVQSIGGDKSFVYWTGLNFKAVTLGDNAFSNFTKLSQLENDLQLDTIYVKIGDSVEVAEFASTAEKDGDGNVISETYATNDVVGLIEDRVDAIEDRVDALENDTVLWEEIPDKPSFASVAFSGDYNDLINKPGETPELEEVLEWFTLDKETETLTTKWNLASDKTVSSLGVGTGDSGDIIVGAQALYELNDVASDGDNVTGAIEGNALVFVNGKWQGGNVKVDLSDIELSIRNHESRISTNESDIEDLKDAAKYFTLKQDENGNYYLHTTYSLASDETVSSLGVGTDNDTDGIGFSILQSWDDDSDADEVMALGSNLGRELYDSISVIKDENLKGISSRVEAVESGLDSANRTLTTHSTNIQSNSQSIAGINDRITPIEQAFNEIRTWFTLEGDVLRTTYSLASDETVSSLGVGSDNGGSGLSYDRLDSWDNYVEGSGAVLGADLGYGLLGRIEELEQGTSGDISEVSAKIEENANAIADLQGEHNTLAGTVNDFLTGVNVDDTINRWKELEKFLAGYTETATLADLLGVKADKSVVEALTATVNSNYTTLDGLITAEKNRAVAAEGALSGRITTNATNIETNRGNIAKNAKDIAEIFATLADWFTLEDGVLHSKYGLASDKTVSSLGVGDDGTGGVSYDRLDSWDNYDADAGTVLSATLGYELKQAIENIDLDDFDLSGYLSKEEASNTYATIVSLGGYQPLIADLGTIRANAVLGKEAHAWGDHKKGGYALAASLATVATTGSYSDLKNVPTKLSDFTDDVVSGKYQPLISTTNKLAYTLLDGAPTALKNPYALKFGDKSYDGSEEKTVTADDLGALTEHQTIYALTIKDSAGKTQLTYTPNVKAGEITLTKAMMGLGLVENTALSTWKGTTNITTLGTVTSGTWKATKIANDYIVNPHVTIAGNKVNLGGTLSVATLQTSLDVVTLSTEQTIAGKKTFTKQAVFSNGIQIGDAIIYWDSNSNALRTDKSFASDSTVSSLGVGEDGSEGLSFDILQSWDNYTDGEVMALGANLGYELKQAIENINIEDLTAYLTKSEAENVYATILSLNGVISRVGNIENTYVISSDLGDFAYKNSLSASDIPNISWSKITSGKPTSLSGYGITDAYTKEEVDNAIGEVDERIDTLVGSSASDAIDTFNEIVAFLKDIEDTETLEGILAGKQDTITDLAAIRDGAALGATALQPSDLDGYVNEITTSGSGNAITSVTKSGKKLTFNKASSFFLAGNFTQTNIKNTLGISDWALASSKPSYKTSEVTEDGNLYFTTDRVKNYLTGAVSSVLTSDLTVSRALISNASGKIAVSAVTSTELGYLDGVTSAIQTQLNALSARIKAYEDILKIEENNTLLHATVAFASDSTVSSLGIGEDGEMSGGVIDLTNVVSNIIPAGNLSIGSSEKPWENGYFSHLYVGGKSITDLLVSSDSFTNLSTRVDVAEDNIDALGLKIQSVENNYVKKGGDTMTGQLRFSGSTYPHIYGNGNFLILGHDNQTRYGLVLESGAVRGHINGIQSLGVSNNRWSNVYSVKGDFASSEAGIIKIKRTISKGGAYIYYYHANQDTNYWEVGASYNGNFLFARDGLDTTQLLINTKDQLVSRVADGTAPFVVASKTLVSNLNADMLDGVSISRIIHYNGDDGNTENLMGNRIIRVAGNLETGNDIYPYGDILQWSGRGHSHSPSAENTGNFYHQLYSTTTGGLYYRSKFSSYAWKAWKQIAFTDSDITGNAATATYATSAGNADTLDGKHASRFIGLYTRNDIGTAPNFDNPSVNGLFELRTTAETPNETGTKPFNDFAPFFSIKAETVMMQIAGNSSANKGWWIRGRQSANVTLEGIAWERLVTEDALVREWNISVKGNAATATKLSNPRTLWGRSFDGSDNVSGALSGVTSITGGSASSLLIHSSGSQSIGLAYNGDGTKAVVLDSSSFRPYSTANGLLDLGSSTARWKGIYGQTLDLTGNANISSVKLTGGKLFLLGNSDTFTDSDGLQRLCYGFDWNDSATKCHNRQMISNYYGMTFHSGYANSIEVAFAFTRGNGNAYKELVTISNNGSFHASGDATIGGTLNVTGRFTGDVAELNRLHFTRSTVGTAEGICFVNNWDDGEADDNDVKRPWYGITLDRTTNDFNQLMISNYFGMTFRSGSLNRYFMFKGGNVLPYSDGGQSLGNNTHYWNGAYINTVRTTKLFIGDAEIYCDAEGVLRTNASFASDRTVSSLGVGSDEGSGDIGGVIDLTNVVSNIVTEGSYTIGTEGSPWSKIYATNLYLGGVEIGSAIDSLQSNLGTATSNIQGLTSTLSSVTSRVGALESVQHYSLTIKNSAGTTQLTYNPTSASGSITLTQAMVGLGNVTNLAASGYLTALSSGSTNAISITVGGTTKNITASTMKSSLGLKALAYKDSLVASDIPSLSWSKITSGKPTTLSGYGITDALSSNGGVLKGVLTIKPADVSGGQDGIILHDSGAGDNEALRIKWTSLKYTTGIDISPNANYSNLTFYDGTTRHSLIHSGNIGSQSVNYATSAGSASSATKLSDNTAYTVWGQTFFENGKPKVVKGNLYLGTNAIANTHNENYLQSSSEGYVVIGYQTSENERDTYIDGFNTQLRYGDSHTLGMLLSSTGTITMYSTTTVKGALYLNPDNGSFSLIGYSADKAYRLTSMFSGDTARLYNITDDSQTYGILELAGKIAVSDRLTIGSSSNLAGTNYKLYVNNGNSYLGGALTVTGAAKVNSLNINDKASIGSTGGIRATSLVMSDGDIQLYKNDDGGENYFTVDKSGNTYIGGTLGVDGAATFGSTLKVSGVTTLSDKLTISKNGMSVNGTAYFGGGTTYYFGSTGNIYANTLSAAATTLRSTLSVTSTSTFTGKTTHNGGIGATSGTFSGTLGVTGVATFNNNIKAKKYIYFGANDEAWIYWDDTNKVLRTNVSFASDGTMSSLGVGSDGESSGGSVDWSAVPTNVIPASNGEYTLGSNSKMWRAFYAQQGFMGGILATTSSITISALMAGSGSTWQIAANGAASFSSLTVGGSAINFGSYAKLSAQNTFTQHNTFNSNISVGGWLATDDTIYAHNGLDVSETIRGIAANDDETWSISGDTGNATFSSVVCTSAAPGITLYRGGGGTPYMRFGQNASTMYGEIGVNSSGNPVYWNYINGDTNWKEFITADNIGDQTVLSSKRLYLNPATSGDLNTILVGGGAVRNYSSGLQSYTNAPSGASYGCVYELSVYAASSLAGQLAWDVNHGNTSDTTRGLWWRAADTSGFVNAKWHQIAFMDKVLPSSGGEIQGSLGITGNLAVQGNINIVYGGLTAANGTVSAKTITQTSDERLKNLIGDVRLSLGAMACAPLKKFHYHNDGLLRVGTIAQYWQGALPEVVSTTPNGTLALAYGELGVAMGISLANILEDTNSRVATVEEEIKTLKEENKRLKERVAELEAA